jgi:hypothetical protein
MQHVSRAANVAFVLGEYSSSLRELTPVCNEIGKAEINPFFARSEVYTAVLPRTRVVWHVAPFRLTNNY